MQKRENTRSSTASVSSSPVISPSARIASRRSMVQKSHGSCWAATSWLRARASAARAARSHPFGSCSTTTLQQGQHQVCLPRALQGRQLNIHRLGEGPRREIRLVGNKDPGDLLGDARQQGGVFSGPARMAVEHQQHHIRRGQSFLAAGNPQLLHRVIGAADAGGVEQGDRHPLQHDLALQQIPGGARQISHDRPLAAAEPIEQGTFSHIGATH